VAGGRLLQASAKTEGIPKGKGFSSKKRNLVPADHRSGRFLPITSEGGDAHLWRVGGLKSNI